MFAHENVVGVSVCFRCVCAYKRSLLSVENVHVHHAMQLVGQCNDNGGGDGGSDDDDDDDDDGDIRAPCAHSICVCVHVLR